MKFLRKGFSLSDIIYLNVNAFMYFLMANHIEKLLLTATDSRTEIIFLIFSSLFLRFLLEMCGQRWIRTIAHTSTLTIIPIVTFIITKIIAGNIALSLGMVGALSIVRFRNPVRSPLELSVYFAAITLGITTSINIYVSIFFVGTIYLSAIVLFITSYSYRRILKKDFFTTSFTEGNSISTLEIQSKTNIDSIDKSNLLKSKSMTSENISYLLTDNNFENLKKIAKEIEGMKDIIKYELEK